ncbi:ATP-binding protein [Planobispora takensis]|uniref:Orc1-like AAA ATPase domain-containing protein n=1 Tax=Planobispora takensis TaxID=1367882 RepID=A0A8J3SW87_9ACTN|nr:ATPase [Planobispora takensis]GII00282.1 hypothetical protein Pta02_22900 [Planobispora takensis]
MVMNRRGAGNLPAETTTLIGRSAELDRLRHMCERSRLVTVTGPGGVGKSRLTLRAAAELAPGFADGVWLVTLSPLEMGASLPYAIAEALLVVNQSTDPMIEVVARYLADRRLLLVWDTCEHLAEACAEVAEQLLAAAPGLRILATSRRVLGVPSEEVLLLEPLPIPAAAHWDGDGDAAALLVERAAAVAPGFAVTEDNRQAVVRICRKLDGLPLAIELAAARLGEWSPQQLATRLGDRFAVLDAGEAGYAADPPWHQGLRTAIGWSHQWCSPAERLLWARASVFAGSFSPAAARRVCADAGLPADRIPALLAALTDKSILTWVPTGDGERYRMLDTVREYGAFWLAHLGQEHELRCRHRDHYRELAAAGEAAWFGPDQFLWFDRMSAELDNLRAALEFALATPDDHCAAELAGVLWFVWYACGHMQEGRYYLDRALAADTGASRARVHALAVVSLLTASQGDSETGRLQAEECLRQAEKHGDVRGLQLGQALLLAAAMVRGDQEQATALTRDLSGRISDELTLTYHVYCLCAISVHIIAGRFGEAVTLLERMRHLCEQHGEQWLRAYADVFRAQAELALGRPLVAQAHARAALEVKYRMHDNAGVAIALDVLGPAALAVGQARHAAYLLGLAHQVWETVGRRQAGIPAWVAARRDCEDRARQALGEQAYLGAYAAGYGTDLDKGVAAAISGPDARSTAPDVR